MNKAETLYYGSQLYDCVRELYGWVGLKLLSSKSLTKLTITEDCDYENRLEFYNISGNFHDFIVEFEEDNEWVKEIYDMVESLDFDFKYDFRFTDSDYQINISIDLKGD